MIHAVYDLTGCEHIHLPDEQIMTAMRETANLLGCTARAQLIEPFQPHGTTCVLILAESHITVSTWPEHHLAHIDVFTCRAVADPAEAIKPLLEALGGRISHTQRVPDSHQPHNHKPGIHRQRSLHRAYQQDGLEPS